MNLANEKAESSLKKHPDGDIEQRSSLPDIPLTNREKAELENSMHLQGSHSSESVLQGIIPPPKPSKDRKPSAPPLPPRTSTRKTFSIDELPDEADNVRQLSTQSDSVFARRIDFNDDDDFEVNETGRSFSASERCYVANRSINETELSKTMIATLSSQNKQFSERNFSSIDTKESNVSISSREFQATTMSSDMHEFNNSFGFMAINHNDLMSESNNDNFCLVDTSDELPPPLPVKTRSRSLRLEHHKSVYDNVEDMNRNSLDTKASTTSSNSSLTSTLSARTENTTDSNHLQVIVKNKYKSCIESGSGFGLDTGSDSSENPPPLPLKKKHSKLKISINNIK